MINNNEPKSIEFTEDSEFPNFDEFISDKKIVTSDYEILNPNIREGSNNIIDDEFVRYYSYLCSLIYYKKYPKEERPDDILELTKALFYEKTYDAKDNLMFIEDCEDWNYERFTDQRNFMYYLL